MSHSNGSGSGTVERKRAAQAAQPGHVYKAIRTQAYDSASYAVDRSVRYEEEHAPSDAALVPVFVHWNTATTKPSPQPLKHEFLWRWHAGENLLLETAARSLVSSP